MARAAIAVVLLALGAAACDVEDAPSRAQFAKNANRICADTTRELGRLGRETPPVEAIDAVIAATRRGVAELADLERPEGDAGEAAGRFVDALERDMDRGLPALEDLRDALRDDDRRASEAAARRIASIETTRTDELARAVGANACVG